MENIRTCIVTGVDEATGGLNICLVGTYEYGYIPAEEISRGKIKNPKNFIERELQVVYMGGMFNDLPTYSAKAVDDMEWNRISTALRNGERNTYPATFFCITAEGKTALYKLAQGCIGAVNVPCFAINRIPTFYTLGMHLPDVLPVTISDMTEDKINLSSIASFGSFAENVSILDLKEGDIVTALVTTVLPDGNCIVMLSPNLSTIINYAPPVGKLCKVIVKKIDHELNRIKCEYRSEADEGDSLRPISDFIIEPEAEWVDVSAFVEANKVKKRPKEVSTVNVEETEITNAESKIEPPTFEFRDGATSPFRIFYEDECVQFDQVPRTSLELGISTGKITTVHRDIAMAVDTLKYTTSDMLHKYIYLSGSLMKRKTLDNALVKLCKCGVLSRFRYSSPLAEGRSTSYFVYMRGPYFKTLCGEFKSYFRSLPVSGESALSSKTRLAENQLVLSLMRNFNADIETMAKLAPCDKDQNALYSSYKAISPKLGECYPEACRRGGEDRCLERLGRYDFRLSGDSTVILTLEDEEHMNAFAERVRELKLAYNVRLTYDTNCFAGTYLEVKADERPVGLFTAIRRAFLKQMK